MWVLDKTSLNFVRLVPYDSWGGLAPRSVQNESSLNFVKQRLVPKLVNESPEQNSQVFCLLLFSCLGYLFKSNPNKSYPYNGVLEEWFYKENCSGFTSGQAPFSDITKRDAATEFMIYIFATNVAKTTLPRCKPATKTKYLQIQ